MLVGFPIALLIGGFATDLTYLAVGDAFWARASFWLLVGGLATGLAAALPGAVDLLTIKHTRGWRLAWIYGLLNIGVLLLSLANVALRWNDMAGAVLALGLPLSAFSVAVLVVTGWLGGEMVFQHGVGVSRSVGAPDNTLDEHASAAPSRSDADHQHDQSN